MLLTDLESLGLQSRPQAWWDPGAQMITPGSCVFPAQLYLPLVQWVSHLNVHDNYLQSKLKLGLFGPSLDF